MRPSLPSERFTVGEWVVDCFCSDQFNSHLSWKQALPELMPRFQRPDQILKHDHRSCVGLVNIGSEKYIVKKFILQSSWFWFQLTSRFFPSLGEIACRNALELNRLGLLTPLPILLLQTFKQKMVTDCWMVYRYLEGRELSNGDGKDTVAYVRRMHEAGWIHCDPHPANFILTPQGLATLDPIRARCSRNRYSVAYDVMLMEHDYPEAVDFYGRGRLGMWLFLARGGHNLVRSYRYTKQTTRQLLGLKVNSEDKSHSNRP
ncbi:MAG: hypothetical protein V2A61_03620 [Calditrichota bacterium]